MMALRLLASLSVICSRTQSFSPRSQRAEFRPTPLGIGQGFAENDITAVEAIFSDFPIEEEDTVDAVDFWEIVKPQDSLFDHPSKEEFSEYYNGQYSDDATVTVLSFFLLAVAYELSLYLPIVTQQMEASRTVWL